MSPRSRHAVPSSGYQAAKKTSSRHTARGIQRLTNQDSFSSTPMADLVPQNYVYSSDSSYGRSRHSNNSPWTASDRHHFHDQGVYQVLPPSTQGGFSMDSRDCVYSQAMMISSGYDASPPYSCGPTALYSPTDSGQHQVYHDQDMLPEALLPMEFSEYDACLTAMEFPSSVSRHAEWTTGLPTPPMENARHVDRAVDPEYMLSNHAVAGPQWNRHNVFPIQDVDMYESFEPTQPPQFSEPSHYLAQPRLLRSASERQDHSGDDSSTTDSNRSKDSGQDKKKPRSDQLYDAKPTDGLYRCPFENMEYCNHKPTKQKCIYDKNLDSHLKPYKCTNKECEGVSFSSNACLFRHEREAHGLHGHNAHLCIWKNCERSQPGNGFPRKWNLGDHMKRVHGYDMAEKVSPEDRRGNHGSSKKRGTPPSTSVHMRRNSSSKDKVLAASSSLTRDDRHSVSTSRPYRPHHGCNVADPYEVSVQTRPYAVIYQNQSRHSEHTYPYVAAY